MSLDGWEIFWRTAILVGALLSGVGVFGLGHITAAKGAASRGVITTLSESINDYKKQVVLKQDQIDQLQKRANQLERGEYSFIESNGICRSQRGGVSTLYQGPLTSKYDRLCQLERDGQWSQLVEETTELLKEQPGWGFLFIQRSVANGKLGMIKDEVGYIDEAIADLQYVLKIPASEEEQAIAHKNLDVLVVVRSRFP
ncbi:hypothetical protein WBQ28_15875 [Pseudomonas syringae pv. syringae]|uniref:hypothetical protein n=1 Tax=Pseudomonas syringae TaxID=317 RepID=UPI003AFFA844